MTLYKIKTVGLGHYYVIAEHPTEAFEKFNDLVNKADYGSFDDRNIESIEIIATAPSDHRFITGKKLIL